MEEIGNNNPADSLATAPPPPAEVKVRTMQSDIEAITKSGGGLPQFQTVKVPSLSFRSPGGTTSETPAVKHKNNAVIILIAVIAVIVVCAVGYVIYRRFFQH